VTKEKWLVETLDIQAIMRAKEALDYNERLKEWEDMNKDLQLPEKQQL
jgi:hypothetical protein